MPQVRMNLTVEPDVPEMLAELAGSRLKMGSYLSSLIRRLHSGESIESDKSLASRIIELENAVRRLEGKGNG